MPFDGFEYKVNGRRVSQDEWLRSLGEEAMAKALPEVAKDIKADVAKLHCPVHHESPKVVVSKIVGNKLQTKISACCDKMLEEAQKIASRQA